MGLSPIAAVTVQNAVLSATSNLLAQALTAYRADKPLIIDWVPVVQFIVWALINTPPNYMWQDYLEDTFPAYHAAPTSAAVEKAARSDDKALDEAASRAALVEPKLNVANTLIKTLLDQTVGAAVNTFLFSAFMGALQAAMARPAGFEGAERSAAFLASGAAIDYARVDWQAVLDKSARDFAPLIKAGWRLWPAVSLVNFALVKSVQGRNLVGGLAGMGWGIYISMFATA